MTFTLLRQHRSKALALAIALGSADSLITLGATSLTVGCDFSTGTPCGAVGCLPPSMTLHVQYSSALTLGEPLTVTVCRDDACISGPFTLGNGDASPAGAAQVTIPPNYTRLSEDHATVTVSGSSTLNIEYFPGSTNYFADGDHYTVTLKNAAGQTLLSKETTVTYTKYYPNGPECGPLCLGANVTM